MITIPGLNYSTKHKLIKYLFFSKPCFAYLVVIKYQSTAVIENVRTPDDHIILPK